MRSRSNGGVIGAYQLPTQNYANGVFFIHDAAIYNTGNNPIWPLGTGFIYSATGGTISTAVDNANYKLHTFTANGTFTVTTGSAYIEIFLVGGGGGGGYVYSGGSYWSSAGGGGGGGVVHVNTVFVDGGTTFTVEVGQAGAGSATYNSGSSGKPSKVTSNKGHSYTAYGGGAGGSVNQSAVSSGVNGGCGGSAGTSLGVSSHAIYNGSPGVATPGTGSPGTVISYSQSAPSVGTAWTSGSDFHAFGGGGGGAVSQGKSWSPSDGQHGYGGDGVYWNRTARYYGAGGGSAGYVGTSYTSASSGIYGNGTRTLTSSAAFGPYGVGGNALASAGTTAFPGKDGTEGTVIFCYRYQ